MPSPFPGMDPYLETSHLWEDFHASLAGQVRNQLIPRLRPRYYAAVVPRVTYDEVFAQSKPYSVKPDVSVYRVNERAATAEAVAIAPPPLIAQSLVEVEVNLYSVEIHEAKTGELVTAIEILSPVNKRAGHEAFEAYQRKRRDLLRSATHLLEIDLLRAGRRWPVDQPLPDTPYFIFLSRDERRPKVEIWPVRFQDALPVVPVPLLRPDADAPLDLGHAVRTIYDEAGYDMRLDYRRPPPPDLSPEDAEWVEALLQSVRVES